MALIAANGTINEDVSLSDDVTTYRGINNVSTMATVAATGRVSAPSFGVYSIAYMVIGSVGIISNLFALVVLFGHKPLRKKFPNFFLINQSLIDLFVGAILILTTGMAQISTVGMSQSAALAMCYIINTRFVFTGLLLASSWNVAALSAERYMEIVHPIRHKLSVTRTKVFLVFVAVWSFGIVYKVVTTIPTTGFVNGVCILGQQSSLVKKVNVLATILVEFVLPLMIITYSYAAMYKVTRKVNTNLGIGLNSQMAKANKNIQKIVVIVIVCLVLSLCPKEIALVIYALQPELMDVNGPILGVCVTFNYSNCCFNTFIYLLHYEEFRRGIRVVILRAKQTSMSTGVNIVMT